VIAPRTAQAIAAAQAVHEARAKAAVELKAVPGVQYAVDAALHEVELRYWKLADALESARKPRRQGA
jgi:hypothetical protein